MAMLLLIEPSSDRAQRVCTLLISTFYNLHLKCRVFPIALSEDLMPVSSSMVFEY